MDSILNKRFMTSRSGGGAVVPPHKIRKIYNRELCLFICMPEKRVKLFLYLNS